MKKTFEEIADALMNHPEIESGLVQQTRAKDNLPLTKDKSGIPEKRIIHRRTYRVFVALPKDKDPNNKLMGKINYEASNANLMDAVREVFDKLKLPLPERLR